MTKTVGGRVEILIDGQVYSTTGEIEIEESNIETDVVNNQDNTIGRMVKPSHYEMPIKFRAFVGIDIQALMNRTFDMSMYERDFGQSMLMTGAFFKGKPKRNTANGEIDGLSVVTDRLSRV